MKVFIVQRTHREFDELQVFINEEQAKKFEQQLIDDGVMGYEIKIEGYEVKQ